jgi:hypothetical protein
MLGAAPDSLVPNDRAFGVVAGQRAQADGFPMDGRWAAPAPERATRCEE